MAKKGKRPPPRQPKVQSWEQLGCAGICKGARETLQMNQRLLIQCKSPRCFNMATGEANVFHELCLREKGWELSSGPDKKFYCKPCLRWNCYVEAAEEDAVMEEKATRRDVKERKCGHCDQVFNDKSTCNKHEYYNCDGNPKHRDFSQKCQFCDTKHKSPAALSQCTRRCRTRADNTAANETGDAA